MSDFDYRWLDDDDYKLLCQWWKDWRWKAPSKQMLPDEGKSGIIISYGGVEICAGFLYYTNSGICFIEYVISNFYVKDRDLRKEAIDLLLELLSAVAKKDGYVLAFTFTGNPHLQESFKRVGFFEGTKNSTEFIKAL